MIEEGLRALELWKERPPRELVAAIYRAMAAGLLIDRCRTAESLPTFIDNLRWFERT